MRQQFINAAGLLQWQALEHIAHAGVGIKPINPGRVDQAHYRCGALAGSERSGEQPVRSPQRDRPDLVLHPVVVDVQFANVDEACERRPSVQALVDGLGGGRVIRDEVDVAA